MSWILSAGWKWKLAQLRFHEDSERELDLRLHCNCSSECFCHIQPWCLGSCSYYLYYSLFVFLIYFVESHSVSFQMLTSCPCVWLPASPSRVSLAARPQEYLFSVSVASSSWSLVTSIPASSLLGGSLCITCFSVSFHLTCVVRMWLLLLAHVETVSTLASLASVRADTRSVLGSSWVPVRCLSDRCYILNMMKLFTKLAFKHVVVYCWLMYGNFPL